MTIRRTGALKPALPLLLLAAVGVGAAVITARTDAGDDRAEARVPQVGDADFEQRLVERYRQWAREGARRAAEAPAKAASR